MNLFKRIAVGLAFAFPISILISQCSVDKKIPAEKQAEYACMTMVEKYLNDPGSAQWQYDESFAQYDTNRNVWVAYVSLRAKNGFNAMIRAEYRCTIAYEGDDMQVETLRTIY